MPKKKLSMHLTGAPAVGKGRFELNLREKMPSAHTIPLGELIRDRLTTDLGFNERFGAIVERGDYIPDEVMLQMFESLMPDHRPDVLITDGYLRTAAQVEHARDIGLLDEDSIVIRLRARRKTCKRRNLNRPRNDIRQFKRRYSLFLRHRSDVSAALQKTQAHIIDAYADDLVDVIFPEAFERIQHWMSRRYLAPTSESRPVQYPPVSRNAFVTDLSRSSAQMA